jgi:hypothetical protein
MDVKSLNGSLLGLFIAKFPFLMLQKYRDICQLLDQILTQHQRANLWLVFEALCPRDGDSKALSDASTNRSSENLTIPQALFD